MFRFSSCTHDQDSRRPTIKIITLTLRVTQKHVFQPPKIKTSFICHESFPLKLSYAKKIEVCGYTKKRETHEALKIAKEKKKKNGTHEGSKVSKKQERNIAHTSKAINQKRENHDQRSTKNIRNRKIFHTLTYLDQSV